MACYWCGGSTKYKGAEPTRTPDELIIDYIVVAPQFSREFTRAATTNDNSRIAHKRCIESAKQELEQLKELEVKFKGFFNLPEVEKTKLLLKLKGRPY